MLKAKHASGSCIIHTILADVLVDYRLIAGYNQFLPSFPSFAITNCVHIPKQMIVYMVADLVTTDK
jgi:hypothetical protein